jgi:hypothetical protein
VKPYWSRQGKIAAAALVALGTVLSAQEPTFVIKVDVPLVSVDVAVKAGSKSVQGLAREDFLLYEDGELQEIKHFGTSTEPIKLLALSPNAPFSPPATQNNPMTPGGVQLAMVADRFYGIMVTRQEPFRPEKKDNFFTYLQLRTAVERMRALPGRKGIIVVAVMLRPDAEPDTAFQELRSLVKESGVPIYFTYGLPVQPESQEKLTRTELLAELSGGRTVAIKSESSDHAHAVSQDGAAQFIRDLAATNYTLAYSPKHAADGKTHKIEIRLSEERMSNMKNQKVTVWQSRDQYTGK